MFNPVGRWVLLIFLSNTIGTIIIIIKIIRKGKIMIIIIMVIINSENDNYDYNMYGNDIVR